MPMHRAGTAGRGPAGNVGALGFEVNLFKLGGYGYSSLGEDPVTDRWGIDASYGVAARRAASDARRSEMLNRAYDQQDAAKRAAERERAIKLSQEAFGQAADTQNLILTSGSQNLTKVMRGTTAVGILALGAFAVTAIFSNLGKKNRDIEDWEHQKKYRSYGRKRSRSRSRRKSKSKSPYEPAAISVRGPTRFSPSFGGEE